MSSILLTASRKYPAIPTVGGDVASHTKAIEALRDAVQTHERRTNDKLSSFVRIKELIDLGVVRLVATNKVELAVVSSSGAGGTIALNDLSDVDLTGFADGDVLTFDSGSGLWVPAAPAAPPSGLVVSSTVTGSAATDITVSGLDLDTDLTYLIDVSVVNATSTDASLRMFMNADTTNTNYDNQLYLADGGSVFAGRDNTARIYTLGSTSNTPSSMRITLNRGADGKVIATGLGTRGATSTLLAFNMAWHWRTATTNVTSITFSSDTANTLAVGSFVRVYRQL